MGREILQTGRVNVWRGDIDAEELLAIRGGIWTYEQLIAEAEAELERMIEIERAGHVAVPKTTDRQVVESLVIDLVERSFSGCG